MAQKKNIAKKATKKATFTTRKNVVSRKSSKGEGKGGILEYFRLTESYASLLLGLIVVIIAATLLVSFVKNRNITNITKNTKQDISATRTVNLNVNDEDSENKNVKPGGTYTVQSGDDLWKIAVSVYGDGYKWTEIAKANDISNPGMISTGQKLRMPDLTKSVAQVSPTQQDSPVSQNTSQPAGQSEKITGITYTVVRGDYLWKIAERAYGDGYRWVDIARVNKLTNPDIIHAGNVIQLPR